MKIECILLRPGGTLVELPGKTYHFAPQDDGRHVADVSIEAHIERLLSIPEAYRLLRTGKAEPEVALVPAEDKAVETDLDVALLGSTSHPATFVINEKAYTLAGVVEHAYLDSGLTAENWNDLDDETRATKIDLVLDAIQAGEIEIETADGEDDAGNDDRDELKAMYEAKFGKSAGRLSTAKIKAALDKAE